MNSNLLIPDFPHDIRLAQWIFFCCVLMLLSLCAVGCLVGRSKKNWFGEPYSYIMRKVWCRQIWIQTYLGFIVLILIYSPVDCRVLRQFLPFILDLIESLRYFSWNFRSIKLRCGFKMVLTPLWTFKTSLVLCMFSALYFKV